MERVKSAGDYFARAGAWSDELKALREIVLSAGLEETVKWGGPCYTFDGKNVVGIGAFKTYFGLWFFQGALLEDKAGVLVNAQAGKTKALRQWRMQSARDIKPAVIKRYVKEALKLAREGREITPDRSKPVVVPPELARALRADKKAGARFKTLGRGAQREYADYVAEAKREETKRRRLEKILPMIAAGAGLNDKYR